MQGPSDEQTIAILKVERSMTDYDDPYITKDCDRWMFMYALNGRSEKFIRLISNNFWFDGHLVDSISYPRSDLLGAKGLLEPNVRIGLFPELYETESGLTRLISNVLCERGKRCARSLLLVTFDDTVVPSYLEFEDAVNLQRDGWMDILRIRFSFKAKTMVRSSSIGSHLDDKDLDEIKIQRYREIAKDSANERCTTNIRGEVRLYIIHGDTKAEVHASKQITDLLCVAKGYVSKQVCTSDKNIVFLPQTIRSFSNSRQSAVIMILDQIHGEKSKASDYGVLFRQFDNVMVLTVQLCDHKGPWESPPHFQDYKTKSIKLSGKYKDWYKVVLDAVGDAIQKTNQPLEACSLLKPVDDSAITIGARDQQRSTVYSRTDLHNMGDLPTIVAPDDQDPGGPVIYHSDGSQSSHLSGHWQDGHESGNGQERDTHYLTPDSSDYQRSRGSLSSNFTYASFKSSSRKASIETAGPTEGETITDRETDARYKSMFDLFDADHDGSITLEEVCSVVGNLGLDWGKDSIKTEMMKVDKDENGKIEFGEFLAMMKSYRIDLAREIKQMFDIIDGDRDGSITAKEIWTTWNKIDIPCNLSDVKSMIAAGDADHNGVIDFEEFKTIYRTLVEPPRFRRRTSTSSTDRRV
ncbi:uncharacterized protein LOC117315211 [Pecten maximus]|uniref:uncharacterized protein LOC117315211 n=1 Tax=Pecten maximus TaxID=6579 RepID=UPI00145875D4|nr:uncharacterized protein LOC117315211 [Pecten maximus]